MTVEIAYSTDGAADAPWLFLGSSLGTTRDMWAQQVEPLDHPREDEEQRP